MSKIKLYSVSLLIPLIAFVLSQTYITDNFSQQVNLFSSAVAFISCLAVLSSLDKGFNRVLLMVVAGIGLRALIIGFLMSNNFLKEEQILACSYVIGYHFLETAIVAVMFSTAKKNDFTEEKAEV